MVTRSAPPGSAPRRSAPPGSAPRRSADVIDDAATSGRGDKDVDTAARWFDVVSDRDLVASEAERVGVPVAETEGSGW